MRRSESLSGFAFSFAAASQNLSTDEKHSNEEIPDFVFLSCDTTSISDQNEENRNKKNEKSCCCSVATLSSVALFHSFIVTLRPCHTDKSTCSVI